MKTQRALLLLCTVMTSSCVGTPFGTDIHAINEVGAQEPAVIKISPPQVFARETLINDRRTEVEYLKTLLKESETITFAPQLRRDLQTLTAIVGQMQVTYDPGAGAQFDRDEALREANNETRLVQAQAALDRARQQALIEQKRLADLQSGVLTPEQLGETQAGDKGGESQQQTDPADPAAQTSRAMLPASLSGPNAPNYTPNTDLEKMTFGEVSGLLSRLDAAKGLLDKLNNSNPVRRAETPASPSEVFNDRQAYRAELRSALDRVNLDDTHDLDGNALYRLHMRATVLPGRHKDKFAVARMRLIRPELSEEEIEDLYFSWLNHISNSNVRERRADFELFGLTTGLYRVVDLGLDATIPIKAPVSSDFAAYVEGIKEEFLEPETHGPDPIPPASQGDQTDKDETLSRNIQLDARFLQTLRSLPSQLITKRLEESAPALDSTSLPNLIGDLNQAIEAANKFTLDGKCKTTEDRKGAQQEVIELLRRIVVTAHVLTAGHRQILAPLQRHALTLDDKGVASPDDQVEAFLNFVVKKYDENLAKLADLIDQLGEKHILCAVVKKEADRLSKQIRTPGFKARRLTTGSIRAFGEIISDGGISLSEGFYDEPPRSALTRPVGHFDAISAGPEELVQSISTVASAANAIELAAALRAALPGQGVSGAAGIGYMRQAIGRIEALERAPIVVGFTDRRPVGCKFKGLSEPKWKAQKKEAWRQSEASRRAECEQSINQEMQAELGWVFGPKLVPSGRGKALELVHSVKNFPVTADVTVPGWWPRVEVEVETAWVKNWYDGAHDDVFDDSRLSETRYGIELPRGAADMEALTDLIFSRLGFGQRFAKPDIAEKDSDRNKIPEIDLHVCKAAREIRLQVKGDNLWQSTAAFLNGTPHSALEILPDMRGVSITFPTQNLQIKSGGKAELKIWTRDGVAPADVTITVIDEKESVNFCAAPSGDSGAGGATKSIALVGDAWFNTESMITLQLDPPATLAAGYYSFDIQGRKIPGGGMSPVEAFKAITDESGIDLNLEQGTVALKPRPTRFQGLTLSTGDLVEIRTAIKRHKAADEEYFKVAQELAYFTADGEKPAITGGEVKVTDDEAAVWITLPRNFHYRYPKLAKPPSDNPAVKINGLVPAVASKFPAIDLGASPRWKYVGQAGTGGHMYTTRFSMPMGNEEFVKALATGVSATVTVGGADGVPAVSQTITLKKL